MKKRGVRIDRRQCNNYQRYIRWKPTCASAAGPAPLDCGRDVVSKAAVAAGGGKKKKKKRKRKRKRKDFLLGRTALVPEGLN